MSAANSTAAASLKNDNDSTPLLSTEQVCVTIHQHMQNMEKSLRCPLCLSCCTDPTTISNCCHTFCGPCIRRALQDKRECPSCKQACSRRSLLPAPHFDELVHAYKKMLVNFGLAPSRFDPSVAVTQIAPGSNDYSSDETENDDDNGSNCIIEEDEDETNPSISSKTNRSIFSSKTNRKQLDWMEVHEQVQAARTFQKYLGERNDSIQKDQEAIVQINERALLKAAVQRQKQGHLPLPSSQAESISLSQQNREYALEQQAADDLMLSSDDGAMEELDFRQGCDDDERKMPAAHLEEAQDDNYVFDPNLDDSQTSFYSAQQSIGQESQSQSRSEESAGPYLDKENVNNATEKTPMMNNKRGGGDKKQKSVAFASAIIASVPKKTTALQILSQSEGHKVPLNTPNSEESKGQRSITSEETVDAKGDISDTASTDQNIAASQIKFEVSMSTPGTIDRNLSQQCEPTVREENHDIMHDHPTESLPAVSNETPNQNTSTASESDDLQGNNSDSSSGSPPNNVFSVGTIVEVMARTWPGVNKPGGVGRVTRIHTAPSVRYDIAYVLGGKEKLVDAVYVSSNDRDLGRKKDVGSIRLRETSIPKALLEDLAKEGFDTMGAPTEEAFRSSKPKKSLFARASRKRTKEKPPEAAPQRTKKPRTIRSVVTAGVNMLRSKKKRDESTTTKQNQTSDVALCRVADARYDEHLESIFIKGTVLHVMATGLSPEHMSQLHYLKQSLKKPVSIKLCESFSKKVQMCIVSAEVPDYDPTNLVSRSRTMKAMRAMMKGIPIISTQWIEACLDAKKVLKPSASMIVRTLPAKTGSNITDYGVAKYCALIQQNSQPKPLASASLHLCGKFSRDLESDVILLAKESGVKAIVSRKAAASKIRNLPDEEIMVILCSGNADLSKSIKEEVENDPKKIIVASIQWLFDSVCSSECQSALSYPPESKDLRQLWGLTTEHTGEGAYMETTNL